MEISAIIIAVVIVASVVLGLWLGRRFGRLAPADEVTLLKVENTRLQTILDKEREAHEEKLALLVAAEERLTLQFQTVAAAILKGQSGTFTKRNKEQLGYLLNPLGEKIKEFQQSLQKAHTETTTERSILKEQIRNLTNASADMMTETGNLTRA